MNPVEMSCPAKTFLIGEYGVLDGGPAILLNTKEAFRCRVYKSSHPNSHEFSTKSPVGQWIDRHSREFEGIFFDWHDPYKGKGGLGFSSAQFNIVYFYHLICRKIPIDRVKPKDLFEDYLSLDFEGRKPSGADVVSQMVGGICIFTPSPFSVSSMTWPFADLDFMILRTGDRLETHKHLRTLDLPDTSDLRHVVDQAVAGLIDMNPLGFLEAIQRYGDILMEKNLVTDQTKSILNEVRTIPEIKAIKPCGAMGAETFLILFEKKDQESLKEKVKGFERIAQSSDLTYGIESHSCRRNKMEGSLNY